EIDGPFQALAGEGGEEIALEHGDALVEAEAGGVLAGESDAAVREVGGPDPGRGERSGERAGEVAGAAAHVDDVERPRAAGEGGGGGAAEDLRLGARDEGAGGREDLDPHERHPARLVGPEGALRLAHESPVFLI